MVGWAVARAHFLNLLFWLNYPSKLRDMTLLEDLKLGSTLASSPPCSRTSGPRRAQPTTWSPGYVARNNNSGKISTPTAATAPTGGWQRPCRPLRPFGEAWTCWREGPPEAVSFALERPATCQACWGSSSAHSSPWASVWVEILVVGVRHPPSSSAISPSGRSSSAAKTRTVPTAPRISSKTRRTDNSRCAGPRL